MIREGWRFVVDHRVMRASMICATAVNFVCGGCSPSSRCAWCAGSRSAPFSWSTARDRGSGQSPRRVAHALARPSAGVRSGRATRVSRLRGRGAAPAADHRTPRHRAVRVGQRRVRRRRVFSICTRTHRQLASPPQLLSRVMATVRFVSWGAIPVGSLTAAFGRCNFRNCPRATIFDATERDYRVVIAHDATPHVTPDRLAEAVQLVAYAMSTEAVVHEWPQSQRNEASPFRKPNPWCVTVLATRARRRRPSTPPGSGGP
jgi:hypothetical protein